MLTPWPEDIGRLARQQRVDLGLSQDKLAERAGVTRQWISRFEQAKADVSFAKALQVLRELGLVVDVAPRAAAKTSGRQAQVVRTPSYFPSLSSEVVTKMNEAVKASVATMEPISPEVVVKISDAIRASFAATTPLPKDLQAAVRRLADAGVLPARPRSVEKPQEEDR